MTLLGHVCNECKTTDLYNETFKVFDDNNNLVGKLHRWVLETPEGYQAKVIAKSKEWIDFEAIEIKKEFPDLVTSFYSGHPGVLILNSAWFSQSQQAKQYMDLNFETAKIWLEEKLRAKIDIL